MRSGRLKLHRGDASAAAPGRVPVASLTHVDSEAHGSAPPDASAPGVLGSASGTADAVASSSSHDSPDPALLDGRCRLCGLDLSHMTAASACLHVHECCVILRRLRPEPRSGAADWALGAPRAASGPGRAPASPAPRRPLATLARQRPPLDAQPRTKRAAHRAPTPLGDEGDREPGRGELYWLCGVTDPPQPAGPSIDRPAAPPAVPSIDRPAALHSVAGAGGASGCVGAGFGAGLATTRAHCSPCCLSRSHANSPAAPPPLALATALPPFVPPGSARGLWFLAGGRPTSPSSHIAPAFRRFLTPGRLAAPTPELATCAACSFYIDFSAGAAADAHGQLHCFRCAAAARLYNRFNIGAPSTAPRTEGPCTDRPSTEGLALAGAAAEATGRRSCRFTPGSDSPFTPGGASSPRGPHWGVEDFHPTGIAEAPELVSPSGIGAAGCHRGGESSEAAEAVARTGSGACVDETIALWTEGQGDAARAENRTGSTTPREGSPAPPQAVPVGSPAPRHASAERRRHTSTHRPAT
eukprot:scaffold3759_cov119-Isochrysis_galbana.AAC.7